MESAARAVVWFNKGFSNVYNALQVIREADTDGRFRLLCTHTQNDAPAFALADEYELEPPHTPEDEYLAYCLDVCRRHRVRVFFAGKQAASLASHRDLFDALGTRLVVAASPAVMYLVDHKDRFYDDLKEAHAALSEPFVHLPEYRTVSTLIQFEEAYQDLRARHARVCFKPAVSVFGLGFRVIKEHGNDLDRLIAGDAHGIHIDEARRLFGLKPQFRDLLVMQYLDGVEYSVDCLGHEGRLVHCVTRQKSRHVGGGQLLIHHESIQHSVQALTARYGLNGLFNVQFKESGGVPYLLEINPRMSGGLHFSCLSGLAFPYWAACLALGDASSQDVPAPRLGIRVNQATIGVLLPANLAAAAALAEAGS